MHVYNIHTGVPYFKIKVQIWVCEAFDMNNVNDPWLLYVNFISILCES